MNRIAGNCFCKHTLAMYSLGISITVYSFLEFLHTTCLKVLLINSLGAQLWVSVKDNLRSIYSFKTLMF